MLMLTWKDGRRLLHEDKLREDASTCPAFWKPFLFQSACTGGGHSRVPHSRMGTVPNAMLHNLKHNKVLHEHNLFVTVRHHEVPWIAMDKRLEIESLGHDCWQVVIHYGFKNDPDVPKALSRSRDGVVLDP
jgi:KUP system potassium uptake protein